LSPWARPSGGPKGNPTITNFFDIVAYLQKIEGSALAVIDAPAGRSHKPRSRVRNSTKAA
jgi:hypothetical protein